MDFYTYDPNTGIADTLIDYDDKNYVNNVRLAFVQNNALRYGKAGQHRLTFKNLFNQLGDNETSLRTGNNYEDGEERHEYSFHYMHEEFILVNLEVRMNSMTGKISLTMH